MTALLSLSGSPAAALVALAAAASWGGGDFSGGMGVKATGGTAAGALKLVMLAHGTSLAVLLVLLAFLHPPAPHGPPLKWALIAGVTAAISLTAFYIALARGTMGPSAALSGLLAAGIPAAVSTWLEGVPAPLRIAGFVLAAAAIWAIAAGNAHDDAKTLILALIGGIGFGIYFVALKLANPLGAFEPMAIARAASLVTCALLWLCVRGTGRSTRLSPMAVFWAMGIALLDTGGNLLFIAATRMGRLDVAAVLASLYPAGTILLAAWRLHERPTRRQVAGMFAALIAVVMITL
jgi:drug/metabolite transporter (DMT)-like permease